MRIEPTIGRVVWFWPTHGGPHKRESEQPLKADVVHVNENGTVNLFVVDHIGNHHREHGVYLVQEGEPVPRGSYCTWMPCQVGRSSATPAADATGPDERTTTVDAPRRR